MTLTLTWRTWNLILTLTRTLTLAFTVTLALTVTLTLAPTLTLTLPFTAPRSPLTSHLSPPPFPLTAPRVGLD